MCGTESWLSSDIKSSQVFLVNTYNTFWKDSNNSNNGSSVFILVKKNLISSEMKELDANCEIIWVKIQLKRAKDILIASFYMPHRDMNTLRELETSFSWGKKGKKRKKKSCRKMTNMFQQTLSKWSNLRK